MNFFQSYNLNFEHSIFSSYMDWFHSFNCSLLLGVLLFVSLSMYFLSFSSFLNFILFVIYNNFGDILLILKNFSYFLISMGPWFFLFHLFFVYLYFNYCYKWCFVYNFIGVCSYANFCSMNSSLNKKNMFTNFVNNRSFFLNLVWFTFILSLLEDDLFLNSLQSGKFMLGCFKILASSPVLVFQVDLENLRLSNIVVFKEFCLFLLKIVFVLLEKWGSMKFSFFYSKITLPPLGAVDLSDLLNNFNFEYSLHLKADLSFNKSDILIYEEKLRKIYDELTILKLNNKGSILVLLSIPSFKVK